jgi:site-specific DNA recombinase
MRLIGYVRVSRVGGREGDSFISPDIQKDRIAAHAKAQGHTVIGWKVDLDQSGGKIERPALEEAFGVVEAGEADGIAVAKLDRFARSVSAAAKALERLEAAGGDLVSVDLGMDTSTPAGRLMRNVLMALAEFELDRISENWRIAKERAIERGVHISCVPPVGYMRDPATKKFVPDPVAAPAVAEIFRRRAAGESWTQLASVMDAKLPRSNGGAWVPQTLTRVLSNRVYLGEVSYGDMTKTDAHEALVTEAEWDAIQRQRRPYPARDRKAMLAGVVYCDACGHLMTTSSDGRRGWKHYRCQRRHSDGVCPAPTRIGAIKAEAFVWDEIAAFMRRVDLAEQTHQAAERYDDAKKAVEDAERELVNWRDSGLIDELGKDAFVAGFKAREHRADNARAVLEELSPPDLTGVVATLDADSIKPDERAQWVRLLVERVVVSRPGPDRLTLEWRELF